MISIGSLLFIGLLAVVMRSYNRLEIEKQEAWDRHRVHALIDGKPDPGPYPG